MSPTSCLKCVKKKCTQHPVMFTTGNSMTSYYHISNVLNMSHDESVQYCVRQTNSYLISLESAQEITFIFNLLHGTISSKDISKMRLNLGLQQNLHWYSKNPFVFFKKSITSLDGKCYFSKVSILEESVDSLVNSLFSDDCLKKVNPSLVICECHEAIPNVNFTHDLTNAVSGNINIIRRRYLFDLLQFASQRRHYFASIQTLDCAHNPSNSNEYGKKYICSKSLNNQFDEFKEKKTFILMTQKIDFFHVKVKRFDISDCQINNEVKRTKHFISLEKYSLNGDFESLCTKHTIEQKSRTSKNVFTLNNIQCGSFECDSPTTVFQCGHQKRTNDRIYKCIKAINNPKSTHCEDNSNLLSCEKFNCPDGLIKCPNSFCIYHSAVNDGIRDCPLGEDEIQLTDYLGIAKLTFSLKEMCMAAESVSIMSTYDHFHCDLLCPNRHMCISSKIEKNSENIRANRTVYQINYKLYNVSNLVYPLSLYSELTSLFSILELNVQDCQIQNFDFAFQYWNFLDLIVLDLSNNELITSNDMKIITRSSQLKVLNISLNENLTIDHNFVFPTSLEIIDLSYTKTSSLKLNVFENVGFLKHLNLSNTLVSTFQDMGIPEYFTLETLYIENVEMTNIKENFFRGLTINSELRASDYKLCCPQILNPNISADKCHAPVDAISSCKHLVGDFLKRITIWTVGFLTLVGNGIVLVYRIGWNREIFKKAYGLFVSGLAVSDFIMGVYLLLIAAVDIHYKDIYVLEDVKWRQSVLCQFAGFLSTLSSETSTFFICLITIDRFLKITFPFGQHKFTKTEKIVSFKLVWFFGFLLALIPITFTEWNIYSSNGLCLALPLGSRERKGWFFSFFVFAVFNFILFLFIAIGQILIFANIFNVSKSIYNLTNDVSRRKTDLNIAKKLAFVALTDFMCWFPVGILGFLSLKGHIFDREVYAWIAVFVMPINSALNPIIYTIPAIYQKYISNVQRRKSSTGSVLELSSFSKVSEWLSRN